MFLRFFRHSNVIVSTYVVGGWSQFGSGLDFGLVKISMPRQGVWTTLDNDSFSVLLFLLSLKRSSREIPLQDLTVQVRPLVDIVFFEVSIGGKRQIRTSLESKKSWGLFQPFLRLSNTTVSTCIGRFV